MFFFIVVKFKGATPWPVTKLPCFKCAFLFNEKPLPNNELQRHGADKFLRPFPLEYEAGVWAAFNQAINVCLITASKTLHSATELL